MHLKVIIDTHLPPSLVKILRKYKVDAIHTTDFPNGHLLNDAAIIKIAVAQHRIIITKDHDFFENFIVKGTPPKILLLETGNIKNSTLFKIFEDNISEIIKYYSLEKAELIILDENNIAYY